MTNQEIINNIINGNLTIAKNEILKMDLPQFVELNKEAEELGKEFNNKLTNLIIK